MQSLVTIPKGVSFPRKREIAHKKMFTRLLFWVLLTPHSRGPRIDIQYAKRHDSAQGYAFWVRKQKFNI